MCNVEVVFFMAVLAYQTAAVPLIRVEPQLPQQ